MINQEVYTAIGAYFAEKGVPYREIRHAPAAATEDYHRALGCRYQQQAKCLFLKVFSTENTYFVVCAIQAQKKADLKALKRLLNAKEVKFASRDELKQHTGCDFGELAPVGGLFGVPLLMDSDFLKEDDLLLNAGRLDVSFAVNPHDLQRAENPLMF